MSDKQFVTFWIEEELFGLDILHVREINRNLDLTRVDLAPDHVRGLMNLRGQVVTVLDLGVRIGLGGRPLLPTSSCIVLKDNILQEEQEPAEGGSETSGLYVDRIGDVISVEEDEIEPPAASTTAIARRFIEGVVKLPDSLLIALKIEEVLSHKEGKLAGV